MALEDIKNKILSDARSKKKELLDEAEAKRKEILAGYRKRAEEFAALQKEQAAAEGEGIRRGIVIDAKARRKSEALRQKRELLDRVFARAKTELAASPDYAELVGRLARPACGEAQDATVVLSVAEKTLDEKFVRELGRQSGTDLKLDSERREFTGGIVLKAGDVEWNLTLDALLDARKEDLERAVAKILFAGGA